MKKNLLFSVLVFVGIAVFAQGPTLTYSNSALIPGDVEFRYECDTTGINPGGQGADYTWNFSNLIIKTNNLIQVPAVNPTSIPGSSSFPSATVALSEPEVSTFYDYSSTQALILGLINNGTTVVYSDPQKLMTFPTSYGTTFTDDFFASYTNGGINTTRTGSIDYTADGWGKLILPGKTFNNVLRLKVLQNVVEDFNGFYSVDIITESYVWFDGISKYPVLHISIITASSIFVPVSVTSKIVYVNGAALGIEKNSLSELNWTLYPNPAMNSTIVAIQSRINEGTLEIYNTMGTKVYSQNIDSEDQITLNTTDFSNGIYIVCLKSQNQTWQKKLIINK